uniref:Uncharacterized protein n=1 Tax=Cacopsylla melanoneura TaxID=428564 RepID=A0A8D9DVK7_9HEMI
MYNISRIHKKLFMRCMNKITMYVISDLEGQNAASVVDIKSRLTSCSLNSKVRIPLLIASQSPKDYVYLVSSNKNESFRLSLGDWVKYGIYFQNSFLITRFMLNKDYHNCIFDL